MANLLAFSDNQITTTLLAYGKDVVGILPSSVKPTGKTITPINDVTIWLKCAGLTDTGYTTLSEVLADTGVLQTLMASNNAVDYLVRCKKWCGTALVPTMTSDTTPSGECIGSGVQGSYPAWKAFDKDSSTFSVTSSVTDYLGYMFETPQCVCGLRFTNRGDSSAWASTIKVQGTNDGISFTDVSPTLNNTEALGATTNFTFANSTKYKGYVVKGITSSVSAYFNASEIQFYSENICDNATAMTYIGQNNYASNTLLADSDWCNAICNSTYFESVLNVKVPTMTSNTTPSGVANATTYSSPYMAYMAFDDIVDNSHLWVSASGSVTNQRLQYKFNRSVKICMAIESYTNAQSTTHPKNIKYQCSSDNATWIDKASETWSQPTGYGEHKTIFSATTSAEYWALYILNNCGNASYIWVHELQFYGREDV